MSEVLSTASKAVVDSSDVSSEQVQNQLKQLVIHSQHSAGKTDSQQREDDESIIAEADSIAAANDEPTPQIDATWFGPGAYAAKAMLEAADAMKETAMLKNENLSQAFGRLHETGVSQAFTTKERHRLEAQEMFISAVTQMVMGGMSVGQGVGSFYHTYRSGGAKEIQEAQRTSSNLSDARGKLSKQDAHDALAVGKAKNGRTDSAEMPDQTRVQEALQKAEKDGVEVENGKVKAEEFKSLTPADRADLQAKMTERLNTTQGSVSSWYSRRSADQQTWNQIIEGFKEVGRGVADFEKQNVRNEIGDFASREQILAAIKEMISNQMQSFASWSSDMKAYHDALNQIRQMQSR